MKKLVVSLILICITSLSFANPPREYVKVKRNSIYLTGGTVLSYTHTALVYERYLHYTRKGLITVRAGGGLFMVGAADEMEISTITDFAYILGENFNHFEMCFGLYGSYQKTRHEANQDDIDPLTRKYPTSHYLIANPSVFAGYRFQLPNGPLVMRFGLGWPELASASIGYSF